MVVMCRTASVALSQFLCFGGQVGPVRKTVARNMTYWTSSKKAVTLEIFVNLIIVAVSAVFLVCTVAEKPNVLVRVWVTGYAVQCLVHAVWGLYEFIRHPVGDGKSKNKREIELEERFNGHGSASVCATVDDDGSFVVVVYHWSFAYRGDCWNLIASFLWMSVGFYWVNSGGKLLSQNAPWLYRLTMIYLTYDLIFGTFFGLGVMVCSNIEGIIAILYPVAGQEGASEAKLSVLPKYQFNTSSNGKKPSAEAGVMVPMDTGSGDSATECGVVSEDAKQEEKPSNEEKPSVGAGVMVSMDTGSGDCATECATLPEDAECCICLCSNDDGIDLRALSCNHRFHATCIEKWFKINATCPVCNSNILKGSLCV